MKLHKLTITIETVIWAESADQAEEHAQGLLRNMDDPIKSKCASEISKASDLPEGWSLDCYPWSADEHAPMKKIGELIEDNAEAEVSPDKMKNASDIFKELPDGSEFAPPTPKPIDQIHKAQRWCEAYDFVRFLRLSWIRLHRGKIYKCNRCLDSGLIATGWDGYIEGRCSCPKGEKYKSKYPICLF